MILFYRKRKKKLFYNILFCFIRNIEKLFYFIENIKKSFYNILFYKVINE